MPALLIQNIRQLTGINTKAIQQGMAMKKLDTIDNAWLLIEDGLIKDFGEGDYWSSIDAAGYPDINLNPEIINASGRLVLPCYCDAHTHLVYAGTRESEFVDRINGLTYEEIFARGGGILNSSNKLRQASEIELFEDALQRLHEIMNLGTGAVEIKSGYGLDVESELKMLRVIALLKERSPLTIKATFLGAHAVPVEYRNNKEGYINLIINEMLPAIAFENLADYCDVFCEENYFTCNETKMILDKAAYYGLKGKVHAEQLSHAGGIRAGVESNAVSVDHLEYCNDDDIALLKKSSTMPVLLPGAQFFLSLKNPPARKMIDAGLPVAISSDYNPGSSPSGNMSMMMSFACVNYKMAPEECINACTINSAFAMGVHQELGSIVRGKKANVMITKEIPSYNFIPYSFANNLVDKVILNGKLM